jgi:uncharacterized protein YndB with AHSA1/START domain
MSQAVHLEVFYPYPPERVWQVLTDRRALATWMMEKDFEPKLGHKFQFYSQPLPGLRTTIQCEVVELEEPTRLVYTWQESPTAERSLVIWTLTTVEGGTQLRLKHHQYSYTTAVAASNRSSAIAHSHKSFELFHSERFSSASGLAITSRQSIVRSGTQSNTSGIATALNVPSPQTFTWDYCLNQKLANVLAQDKSTHN